MKWFRRDKRKKKATREDRIRKKKLKREERFRKKLAEAELAYAELMVVQLSVENEMLGKAVDLDRKRRKNYIT